MAAGERAVAEFTEHFRSRAGRGPATDRRSLPLDQRLARAIVEGSKVGLEADLAEALDEARFADPLAIINGPLMAGMSEVGRLFNDNRLILAEVLQSAEVMKAAVDYLEPHMTRIGDASRGKVLLATVKGDVHDLGKNLVEIVLANNGFRVVNLGIKVPSEQLIQAVAEHRPDVIGLSGLLVKASINRIAAWVIGTRNMSKALLLALLAPIDQLRAAELAGDYTTRLGLMEDMKLLTLGAVWDYYCHKMQVPVGSEWLAEVKKYEQQVLSKRV